MFDQVHLGWLESDDYRVAARAAGVVELPDGLEPDRREAGAPGRPPSEPPTPPTPPAPPTPAEPPDPNRLPRPAEPGDLAERLATAPVEVWGRLVLAVAAMHEPDATGRCRLCRPDPHRRWWRRPPARPCPTRRMLLAGASEPPATPDGGMAHPGPEPRPHHRDAPGSPVPRGRHRAGPAPRG